MTPFQFCKTIGLSQVVDIFHNEAHLVACGGSEDLCRSDTVVRKLHDLFLVFPNSLNHGVAKTTRLDEFVAVLAMILAWILNFAALPLVYDQSNYSLPLSPKNKHIF